MAREMTMALLAKHNITVVGIEPMRDALVVDDDDDDLDESSEARDDALLAEYDQRDRRSGSRHAYDDDDDDVYGRVVSFAVLDRSIDRSSERIIVQETVPLATIARQISTPSTTSSMMRNYSGATRRAVRMADATVAQLTRSNALLQSASQRRVRGNAVAAAAAAAVSGRASKPMQARYFVCFVAERDWCRFFSRCVGVCCYSARSITTHAMNNSGAQLLLTTASGESLHTSADLFPSTIQGLIQNRVDQLTPAQQLVLRVAAVIGNVFEPQLLIDIMPLKHGIDPRRQIAEVCVFFACVRLYGSIVRLCFLLNYWSEFESRLFFLDVLQLCALGYFERATTHHTAKWLGSAPRGNSTQKQQAEIRFSFARGWLNSPRAWSPPI
jgi:hypothetical protein